MKKLKHQMPGFLQSLRMNASEARRAARVLGIKPAQGESYLDLPLFKVPPELHDAVKRFAGKLTRATFFIETGQAFPSGGGIVMNWFTNGSQTDENGVPQALAAFAPLASKYPDLRRSGKDLSDQFAVRLSLGEEYGERLFVVQATFRRAFGFICIASTKPDHAEGMLAEVAARVGSDAGPFIVLPKQA